MLIIIVFCYLSLWNFGIYLLWIFNTSYYKKHGNPLIVQLCVDLKEEQNSKYKRLSISDSFVFVFCHLGYRTKDVGKGKATVAADFINDRVAGCKVTPYPFIIIYHHFVVQIITLRCFGFSLDILSVLFNPLLYWR